MRAMYTDENDNLAVCKIISLTFDKEKRQMLLKPQSEQYELLFSGITPSVFRYYVKKLFLEGYINLSCYKAVKKE